jgi:hypothetical protein
MNLIKFNNEEYDLKILLDAKYPLMEKLRDRAPGTYKHSQNVANLCESVALELNIDPNLMKVLGMYHDIGKISYPECFYENQNGSGNMHDKYDPITSFHLLSKHVSDSALILVQIKDFPSELIIPITQHHGNTTIKSLANKANADENLFRYKNTCPPTTLEAAVLMICDSVDATIRSKEFSNENITLNSIRDIIEDTIQRLVDDEQLDEIRVGDLKHIKKSLQKDIESKYHKRDASVYNKKQKQTKTIDEDE